MTWLGGHTGAGSGAYFQQYAPDGTTDGGETRAYGPRDAYAGYPTVAMGQGGNFLIAYRATDADINGVYVQRYAPAPLGTPNKTGPIASTWAAAAAAGEAGEDEEIPSLAKQVLG